MHSRRMLPTDQPEGLAGLESSLKLISGEREVFFVTAGRKLSNRETQRWRASTKIGVAVIG